MRKMFRLPTKSPQSSDWATKLRSLSMTILTSKSLTRAICQSRNSFSVSEKKIVGGARHPVRAVVKMAHQRRRAEDCPRYRSVIVLSDPSQDAQPGAAADQPWQFSFARLADRILGATIRQTCFLRRKYNTLRASCRHAVARRCQR